MFEPKVIIDFWFQELDEKHWWMKDETLDKNIYQRFGAIHHAAAQGELFDWRETAPGRLAEIIVLDQFSRNIYRDTAKAFAADGMALVLAQEAIRAGADLALSVTQRAFVYLPLMHSESAKVHEEAVRLFNVPGMENNYNFELKHKAIIDRFGRYPHRNEILGRESSPEEIAFLQEPDSSF